MSAPQPQPEWEAPAGRSGVRLVADGLDAFALRTLTTRAAQRGIDVQSYIWHSDLTGRLLAFELLRAADRGVAFPAGDATSGTPSAPCIMEVMQVFITSRRCM